MSPRFERITARDIEVGDQVCLSRNDGVRIVLARQEAAETVWLTLRQGAECSNPGLEYRIRPGYMRRFWRLVGM